MGLRHGCDVPRARAGMTGGPSRSVVGGSVRIPGTLCAARVPVQSHVALSQVSGCTPPSPYTLPACWGAQSPFFSACPHPCFRKTDDACPCPAVE